MKYDLLCIGDISLDMFMKIDESELSSFTSSNSTQICFLHGAKIAVKEVEFTIAGNSLNVCVGSKKLGLDVKLYSETGDDYYSMQLVKELGQMGAGTEYIKHNAGKRIPIHPVMVSKTERTIFSYHENWKYNLFDWGNPKWIYYTSMCPEYEDFQAELVDYVKKNPDIGIAFGPGTYHMRSGVEKLKNILEVTDILILNEEEAQSFVGKFDSKTTHKKLQELGPNLTVVTAGKNGASADDGNIYEHMDAVELDSPIVDKTGAGDSFSSAFMAAILHKKSLKEALKWGVYNSAANITEIGSITGILDLKQMQEMIK